MSKIPLGAYILQRLHQCGVSHLHGVPGDYSLPFLSHLKRSPVKWIGSCNELNDGYAADGYARMRGLGALCTTFGVGELSAINAIAGSRAESVSVMNIVGTPSRKATALWRKDGGHHGRGLMHHMLGNDTSIHEFEEIHRRFAFAASLEDETRATNMFDEALTQALQWKGPAYVALPSDMADVEVHAEGLERPIKQMVRMPDQTSVQCLGKIVEKFNQSQRPLIMVDGVSERYGFRKAINNLVRQSGIPTVCLQHGLGIVDGDVSNYYGVYAGSLATSDLKAYVDESDFVLLICPLLSDTGTAGWTASPNMQNTICIDGYKVKFDQQQHKLVDTYSLLENLASELGERPKTDGSKMQVTKQYLVGKQHIPPPESPISQDYLWPRLSSFFRSGDTILLANGTPIIGSRLFDLPPTVRVIASGLWYSVGQMLPAAQGAALAMQDKPTSEEWSGRTILLEGDGSFQATAQELSTIMRYKIDCTIIIANNEGYAYERLIEGPEEDFNDVADWKYTLAPEMMGGKSTREYPINIFTASNVAEMETILDNEAVQRGKGLTLVDVTMGRMDVPKYFREALSNAGKRLRAA